MENFIVSARKYRPASFDTVVGQLSITSTLRNAILNRQLAQAYLFCGPRGVGKTTCARIFAKTINCMNPGPQAEPCNECESCRAFNTGRSLNIHELDAASNNSVDDIRSLVDQVRILPQIGKYSVYIIDEVHMLSTSAFNAFLKTLEEPPAHAVFILATTEKHKILPTILSRCQIYDFNRMKAGDTVSHLKYIAEKEGIKAESEALDVIAQKADGAMRDALSIFDQVVSFCGPELTYAKVIENLNVLDYEYYFRLTDLFREGKVGESFLLFNEILEKGFDAGHLLAGLGKHFRDVLVARDSATLQLLEVSAGIRERYVQQAADTPVDFLYEALRVTDQCEGQYKVRMDKKLCIEITLIKLCQILELKKKI
jgi:DNA polymerase-3 subunit gamma/tau